MHWSKWIEKNCQRKLEKIFLKIIKQGLTRELQGFSSTKIWKKIISFYGKIAWQWAKIWKYGNWLFEMFQVRYASPLQWKDTVVHKMKNANIKFINYRQPSVKVCLDSQ